MPNALTLEHMSPGLVKVVETCNHEPHRRKSRMREIRSSGSGEGPGWVTARPTLQRPFPPPAAPAVRDSPAPQDSGRTGRGTGACAGRGWPALAGRGLMHTQGG